MTDPYPKVIEIAWPQDAPNLIEMARDWPVGCSDAGDMFSGDVLIKKLGGSLEAAVWEVTRLTQERDKWLDLFNRSEQFQNGPTKRAEQAEADLLVCQQSRETARAMLDNLSADIEKVFNPRFRAIVDKAEGDISVNTAFQVALRDERQAHADELEVVQEGIAQVIEAMRTLRSAPRSPPLLQMSLFKLGEWAETLSHLMGQK